MTDRQKIVVIIGSPRGRESVSQALADFLSHKLSDNWVETEMLRVTSTRRSKETVERSHLMMDSSDAVLLVFPLIADQLPSGMVKFLEDYSLHRKSNPPAKQQSLMALVTNRFPEASQCDKAVSVARRFAELEGFLWLGGITLGETGLLPAGGNLEKGGRRVSQVLKTLEAAALCLARCVREPLPLSVLKEARKPVLPAWLYRILADWSFRRRAGKNGVRGQMKARPFSA